MSRNRPALASWILAVLISCLGSGCREHAEEEKAGAIPVLASPVRQATFIELVRSVGVCAPPPERLALVTPAMEGSVLEILVAEGDEVEPMQPLVRLDDKLAVQDLAEKRAAKAELEAALVLLRAPPREQDRRAAELDVERARLAAELAQAVVARLEPLHERKEVSDPQLFEAKEKLADAAAAFQSAQAKLDLLVAGARPEAVAEAEAKVARAEASAAASAARLTYFTLTSPLHGTVEAIHCRPGQSLAPGALAVEVIDTTRLIITATVPAADAARVKPSQPARILIDPSEKDCPAIEGRVGSVGAQASAVTGAFPIRVLIDNADGKVRSGMVVRVEVAVGTAADVLAVPDAAILASEEEPTIAVIRGGKAALLHPRFGLRQGGLTQVTIDGLSAGELVVTRGAYDLPDGADVMVETPHANEQGEVNPRETSQP